MHPRPPALDTAAARGPPEVRAIPASRIGCWIPRRVVRGVVRGPEGDIVGMGLEVYYYGWYRKGERITICMVQERTYCEMS